LTAPLRVLPDFLIPGEAKCGTTSMYRYLLDHPAVLGSDVKEPRCFLAYGASPLLCRRHFPLRTAVIGRRLRRGAAVVGEATAEYFSRPDVPAVVHRVVPRARIIVLLRDPVARAFSDYQMLHRLGREPRSFAQVVDDSLRWLGDDREAELLAALAHVEYHPLRCVGRGLYLRALRRWREVLEPGQCLVLCSERFFADPQATLDRVFEFLGLPGWEVRNLEVRRAGGYTEEVPAELAARLREFYRPHNEELVDFLDDDFGW
jgi:hypothetical protein